MTTELTYLSLTLILALVQVFLPAGARTVEFGSKWNAGARDTTPQPEAESAKRTVGRIQFEPCALSGALAAQTLSTADDKVVDAIIRSITDQLMTHVSFG